ncbi:MAG: hypothetical protein AAGG38_15020 [Planctomycetota bacterium]
MSWSIRRTTDPDTFAAWLAESDIAHFRGRGRLRVVEHLTSRSRWIVEASAELPRLSLARRGLLLQVEVGHRLTPDDTHPAAAWPTHAAALANVRDVVRLLEAAAADAGLAIDRQFDVSAAVRAERPAASPTPTAPGRRLAGVLAWCTAREGRVA